MRVQRARICLRVLEGFCDLRRRRSSLGYFSPINYERRTETARIEANVC
jgi:hypothetical protein